jgi:hypothetical protein
VPFVAHHVHQFDGSACAATNCWASTGAWLVANATRGHKDLTPMEFRALARAYGCRTGGLGDIIVGLDRLHLGFRLYTDLTRERARDLFAREGYVAAVPTDYERLPRNERAQEGDFYHMMGLVCGPVEGQYRVMDPLRHHMEPMPVAALLDAALGYGMEHGDGRTLDAVVVKVPTEPHRAR